MNDILKIPNFVPFGGHDVQWNDLSTAQIVILPICYEQAPSYGSGCQSGPLYLLDASTQLENLDEVSLTDWTQRQIHTLNPLHPKGSPQQAIEIMAKTAAPIFADQKFLLSIGGDHAITLGPIQAAAKLVPNLSVLQIDAHLDLRNEWNQSRYNHGCVMRRVLEDLHIPFAQVGTRAIASEELAIIKKHNLSPIFAHKIEPDNSNPNNLNWIQQALEQLTENVYITIDLDGLDPSVIPGTGTPEPGGLSFQQLMRLLMITGKTKKIIAADIVELCKIPGSQVSEYTAAKIASKIFVYCLTQT